MNNNCFNEQIYLNENVHFSEEFVFICLIQKLYSHGTKDECTFTVFKQDKLQGKTINISNKLAQSLHKRYLCTILIESQHLNFKI